MLVPQSVMQWAMVPTNVNHVQEMFGCGQFRWYRRVDLHDAGWCVFCNRNVALQNDPEKDLYHATTLPQCQKICTEGFLVGLHHAGTQSSPRGIWGCSEPGHAVDRCPLSRGWSKRMQEDAISAWDVPVVFRWQFNRLKRHKHLRTGVVVVHPSQARTLPVTDWPTEIWIHYELYAHFATLAAPWPGPKSGALLPCRARACHPEEVWKAGDCAPMTCGRICEASECESSGWQKTGRAGTLQYRCFDCEELSTICRPCTDRG